MEHRDEAGVFHIPLSRVIEARQRSRRVLTWSKLFALVLLVLLIYATALRVLYAVALR